MSTRQQQKSEKIQKVLANAGLASRREIETWLSAGRIKLNGVQAKLGDRMHLQDKVLVDGRLIKLSKQFLPRQRVLLFNKAEGVVCSARATETCPSIFAQLPSLSVGRWVSIGRLDVNTSGLILFTTDGELAHAMMHPSFGLDREYAVRVVGELSYEQLAKLSQGVQLEDGLARFVYINDGGGRGMNHWYHVVLKEGRNREVRRMFAAIGVKVNRLIRIRYGHLVLPKSLKKGRYLELSADEVTQLARSVKNKS